MVVKGSRGSARGELFQDGASARRVASLSEVAGKWGGTCDFGAGLVPCTLTIGPDGSFAGTGGASSAVGKVAVVNGRAAFDTGTVAGDLVLHDGAGCPRQLALIGAKGVARGQLTPQQ